MDNRCQKDLCSALGGFSVSGVIRNIPVSADLLIKVIHAKYGFNYEAVRTGICGYADMRSAVLLVGLLFRKKKCFRFLTNEP